MDIIFKSRKSWLSFMLLVMVLCPGWQARADDTVRTPDQMRSELKLAVDDLLAHLQAITGREYQAVTSDKPQGESDIILARSGAKGLPATIAGLTEHNSQAYHVFGDGKGPMWIVGHSDLAIANGLYSYLELLGVRWLLPSEKWTVIPSRSSVKLSVDKLYQTQFLTRTFFGTGGFGGKHAGDPEMKIQRHWEQWMRRMRYNGPIKLGGHTGEAFNKTFREQLEAHPQYLAMIDGKRQPWSVGVKFCVSNPDVLALYTQWRLDTLADAIKRDPNGPLSFATSVDPADGGGHCTCPDCLKLGSVSDRVFTCANQVAKAVAQKFPGKFVNLYAYNEHAFVPGIDLESNIIVSLVPYGLHRTGMNGQQFIEAWSRKVKMLSIYSYWGVTDWTMCRPTFSFNESALTQLDHWRENNVSMIALESSHSSGSMGWILYALAHMAWDSTSDPHQIIDSFCQTAFGKASSPMNRLFDRWSDHYLQSDHELATCFANIQEAMGMTSDPAVQARLRDMVLYVQYLALLHDYEKEKANTPESLAMMKQLLEHVWKMHDTAMVHSYRIYQLAIHRRENKHKTELEALWPIKDPTAQSWQQATPYTSEQVDQMLIDGLAKYKPLDFKPQSYTGDYVTLPDDPMDTTTDKRHLVKMSTGELEFKILISEGMTELAFDFRAGPVKNPNHLGDPITLVDADGKTVYEKYFPADGQWQEIVIPVSKPGVYSLKVYDQKAFCLLKLPQSVYTTMVNPFVSADVCSRMYFYIPKGQKTLAFFEAGVIPITLFNNKGQKVDMNGQRGIVVVDVPQGQDGTVWSFWGYKSYTPMRMLNVPHALSVSPNILVPESALEVQ